MRPLSNRRGMSIVFWVLGGIVIAYFFDPERGHARRIRSSEQALALLRRSSERAQRRTRRLTGEAHGAWRRFVRFGRRQEPVDDTELTHMVETRLYRDPKIPKGKININAENGVVVLRGQLPDESLIRDIEETITRMPSVKAVTNYMHLPGTPAPNKAAVYHISTGQEKAV